MKDDAHLIQATLAGDSSAFGLLVRKYQDRLFNTLVHVIGCREESEDLVQDAFVQAFVKLETFQGTSAFYTWLYRIAFNFAMSRKRRKGHNVSLDAQRETSHQEPRDAGESAHDRLLREERAEQIRRGLAALSDEHRSILVLREIDGCCYETIGEILNLPVGTVRSRLHRARLQLRDELKEVLAENPLE
ncbi:MAG: polymerase sigma-E factor [Planctomycetota bacterium]